MGVVTEETITLGPGEAWTKRKSYTADADSYQFKLITEDSEATITVEVVDKEEECELEMLAHKGGTTEPQPGTHSFPCGETLKVEAIAAEGWDFTGWEREGSATTCNKRENPCVFEITRDSYFAAHFTEEDNGYKPPAAREVNVEVLPHDAREGDAATIHVYGAWENSCAPEYLDHTRSLEHVLRIETINRSEACLMAVTDFSLLIDIDELPPVLRVEVYYESPPRDYFALIASEHFSFSD